MSLKHAIDTILADQNRTFSWLAKQMGKTFDGLKLSLIRESIKYKDIIRLAAILEVTVKELFVNSENNQNQEKVGYPIKDLKSENNELKNSLKNCSDMTTALKQQVKDKQTIIDLMNKR